MNGLVHAVIYWTLRAATSMLGRLRRSGMDLVPSTGGVLFCPNHLSDSDPAIVLVSIPRRAWFIGKDELFKIPFAKWLFRALQGLPIKRDSADRAALRQIEEILRRGDAVVMFPEGRCSQSGRLQRVQPGAALLALRTGSPIVPVGLKHTAELLPYGSLMPRFAKDPVTIEFGIPIDPRDFDDLPKNARVDAMTERLVEALAALTGQEMDPQGRHAEPAVA